MRPRPGDTRRVRRQTGFTLLEMLVVVTVLGLLMLGLMHGVRTGLSLWEAQSRRVSETASLDAAARILRTLLSGLSLRLSATAAAAAAGAPQLEGTADRLSFIGELPTGLGTTRRANITLELRQRRLVLRWTPHRHELSDAPRREPVETELVRRVDRLDLAYWGSPSPEQPAGWVNQWAGPAVPELIRLRLVFASGDRRRFPDLIAAPQP